MIPPSMVPLALVGALAAVAPRAEGMMRPHLQAPAGEAPGSLVEDLAGASSGTTARRTCAPQSDDLQPGSSDPLALLSTQKRLGAEALGSDVLERRRGSQQNHSFVRPCGSPYIHTQVALVLPKQKLAFCYVQKVGCTDFKDLFNAINGIADAAVGFYQDYYSYYASAYFEQGVDVKDMTKENGWKFAAFTRDPALRYLSAFGDVCAAENSTEATLAHHKLSCCGEPFRADLPLEAQAHEFRQRALADAKTGRPEGDLHWSQQTEVLAACGGKAFEPDNLDYWGILSGDVNSQVKEMLQMVDYRNDTLVERFFPRDRVAGHTGLLKGEPSDYIRDLETLEAIIGLYEDDYRRFPGIGCAFTEPLLAKLRAANASSA